MTCCVNKNKPSISTEKEILTPHEAYLKAMKYCAYQDRCTFEVSQKLQEWGIFGKENQVLIDQLRNERYIDDYRFACSFVRGKHHYKKWGRQLILQKLKEKRLHSMFVNQAINQIDETTYCENLKILAQKKWNTILRDNLQKRTQKTYLFLTNKGYETPLIWEIIGQLKLETP